LFNPCKGGCRNKAGALERLESLHGDLSLHARNLRQIERDVQRTIEKLDAFAKHLAHMGRQEEEE